MSDKIYRYAVYTVLGFAGLFSLFLIGSDNFAPFTTQATVNRAIVNIAPEVSGVVTDVFVNNGQQVKAGDLLFSLDKSSYQIALQQADAEFQQALESDAAKKQEMISARQVLKQREEERENAEVRANRYQVLRKQGSINQQAYDDVLTVANIASNAVEVAKAGIMQIQAELSADNQSAAVSLAEAKVAAASLDLANTEVRAETRGIVSNLQLESGTYVNKGSGVLFLVSDSQVWLNADFNEKGVAHLTPGTQAVISFDALPGETFTGQISNRDSAVYDNTSLNNQLANVTNDSRWIREQQKIRNRIAINDTIPELISGAKASVMVKNGNPLVDAIATGWITLISYFRYIY